MDLEGTSIISTIIFAPSLPAQGTIGLAIPTFSLHLSADLDSRRGESAALCPEGWTLGSDGFFWDASQVRYRRVYDSHGEIRYEEVSFDQAEQILSAMDIEAQTSTIVGQIVERFLDPLVEGTDPSVRKTGVNVEAEVDLSIPETQPKDQGSRR